MLRFMFTTLAVGLIIVAVLLGSLYLNNLDASNQSTFDSSPEYHIQIITPNTKDHFWTTLKKGALVAAEELNIYVEFVSTSQKSADLTIEAAEKAILSKVDGFALQSPDIERTSVIIEQAEASGIKVLTFESDNYSLPMVPSVYSNSYDIGMMAAEISTQFMDSGEVAVIIDATTETEISTFKNLKLQGIIDKLQHSSTLKIGAVYTLEAGAFEIDKLVTSILEENPNLQGIICTDERSTPGVANVIVDANKVGDIAVIGYGAMPQTLEYIERGVISATIYPDAYHIGYETVYQLFHSMKGEAVDYYTTIDVAIITKENYQEFLDENQGK